MMIKFSHTVLRYIRKTKIRDPQQYRKIKKTLILLKANPNHLSLKLHKLSGKYANRWSISIDRGLRITFLFEGNNRILLISIGTHDQVYR